MENGGKENYFRMKGPIADISNHAEHFALMKWSEKHPYYVHDILVDVCDTIHLPQTLLLEIERIFQRIFFDVMCLPILESIF